MTTVETAPIPDQVPPLRDFSVAQLKLIRRSVARMCTDAEFDEFMAVARQVGLDPLRRQLAPLIVNADDHERRRLLPWTTIDGLRVIAARQGDYRPMETAPTIEIAPARVDADRNPLGLVRAEVVAWKRSGNRWHPVAGEAWWDEFAPLRQEWAAGDDGRRRPTERMLLDTPWSRMGRVMLAKCAEAQALRRGWPHLMSGLYGEEELHAAGAIERTASERLHARANQPTPRQSAWFLLDDKQGVQCIQRGEIATRLRAFIAGAEASASIEAFVIRNKLSLSLFWDWEPEAALELKRFTEERLAKLTQSSATGAGDRLRSKRSRQGVDAPR